MKKVLALMLAVVMCFGMASVAFGIDVDYDIPMWAQYDASGNGATLTDDTIAYVAGETFYVSVFDGNGDKMEITSAEVTQGSTTVYAPAFYEDTEGNAPLGWVVQMKTQDIAAVKEYDTVLKVEAVDAAGQKYAGSVTLIVKDYDLITDNDINKARIDGDFEVATQGRYVVSAEAFKAIKSGETFAFPYSGYTLNVGTGISNALNFRASTEKIDKLVEKYGADKILGFLDFKDKNDLPVEIGVEMECTEYSSTHTTNKAYVYRIEGDKLVLVTDNAKYDAARDVVTFKTNKLGSLVISAAPLTDSASTTTPTTTTTNNSGNAGTTTSNKNNPGTGANDLIGLAVAGAVVATAAGFVAMKK